MAKIKVQLWTEILSVLSLVSIFVGQVDSVKISDNNLYRHYATLDPEGKYKLEWLVDWDQKRVTFNVTVASTGYIGFGMSTKGKMAGADIVIGGVDSEGNSYFTDRHAIGNQLPEVDISQDWALHACWERHGHTFLSFSRPFDTCDADHDLPITDNLLTLIWAYSETDDQIQYHFQNRGVFNAYLLDPQVSINREIDRHIRTFPMRSHIKLPAVDTLYWCTFYKVPTTKKNHIVGFDTKFPSEVDRRHVHHFLLHRCTPPPGTEAESLFEAASRSEGSQCFIVANPNPLPTQYCRESIYVWAVGGKEIYFPEHAGLPMSESGSEYFMLQVHYDNPNMLPNLSISVTVEAYYTDNLRENDVGMLGLGDIIPGSTSIIIPPNSLNHAVFGHCAPGCTEKGIPKTGIHVFAGFLHTHTTGTGVRLMQFSGDRELPWILADDNYNFNYQQIRHLREERTILPGDLLMTRCMYETTSRNGSAVFGGFSSREEMCTAFVYYYGRSPGFSMCRSEIRDMEYWNRLGIRNTTWDESRRQVVITSPPQYAGLSIAEYANTYITWDIERREVLQRDHLYLPQVSQCPNTLAPPIVERKHDLLHYPLQGRYPKDRSGPDFGVTITVPVGPESEHESYNPKSIPRYSPPPQCKRKGGSRFGLGGKMVLIET